MAQYTLMKHQKKAVKFLKKNRGVGALLMDPGTGKTGSTLAYLDHLADKYGEVRVLVVAPLTAADTWVLQVPLFMDSSTKARMLQGRTADLLPKIKAARNWLDVPTMKVQIDHPGTPEKAVSGNRVTILSMSAGAISSWCRDRTKTASLLGAVRTYAPHLIVVDESHIIKSPNSTISKAMDALGRLAPHRIILTGTVTPLGPLDVYGQWRFLAPWTFSDWRKEEYVKKPHKMTKDQVALVRPWSWTRFKARYSLPGGYRGKGIGGYCNQKELKKRIAERSLVIRKRDALDLPPITDIDVHVTLTPKEQRAYTEMARDLVAQMEDGSLLEAMNPLAKIMKLRQITAGFAKDPDTDAIHQIGLSKWKAVQEVANTTLAGEKRVVVFAYFRHECEQLANLLAEKGTKVEVITGGTKNKERLAIRQRFLDVSGNPERTILVAQARTMSISVNELVSAQHAIYASLSEQRADWVQSRDRLDRKGQTLPVTFWNVMVPDSIDTVMRDNHLQRGDMEKALLDHIRLAGR